MKWLIVIGLIWLAWHYLGRKPKRPAVSPQQRARRILGVAAEADEADIRAAHRRLLAEFHPDRGGSESATREINAARDLLIEGLRRPA